MGSIPAPNIAADAAQTAMIAPNAAAEYARAAQLSQETANSRAMAPLQQQSTQQQIQAQQQQNQAQQMQLQEQQTMRTLSPQFVQRDANGKPTGFDTEGYYNALLGQGVSPNTVAAQRQAQVNMQKSLIGLNEDQLAYHNKLSDQAYQLIEPLRQHASDPNANVDDINQTWAGIAPQLQRLGVDPRQLPASFRTPQEMSTALGNFEAELGQHKQMLADAKTGAETAQANAKARQDAATAAHQEYINNLSANSKPGDFDAQIDALVPGRDPASVQQNGFVKSQVNASLKRGDFDSAKKFLDQAFETQLQLGKELDPRVQAGKVAVAGATAAARNAANQGAPIKIAPGATGEAALEGMDPTTAAAVRMIGDSKAKFSDFTARTTPAYRQQLAAAVHAYNPDFDENTYQVRGAEERAITSGTQGQQLTAIATSRNHMATFKQAADALDNGNFKLANQVGNWIGTEFGSDKATNFNVAKSAFAGEVGKAFAGANVGVADRQELMDKISAASSFKQLKGYADTADELLAGKQKAMRETHEKAMKNQANFGNETPTQPATSGAFSWDNMPKHQ